MDTLKIFKGYTVAFNYKNGDIGFLNKDFRTDTAYFSKTPDLGYTKRSPDNPLKYLLKGFPKMDNFNGNENVDFTSGRIVKLSWEIQDIAMDEKSLMYERAKSKLTEEEFVNLVNVVRGE